MKNGLNILLALALVLSMGLVMAGPMTAPAAAQPVTSGLVLHLDATQGITKDGSNKVSAWADQSGAGNNAAQATSAKQPLWVANVLDGKPIIRFANASKDQQWMSAPSVISGTTARTIFVVTKPASVSTMAVYALSDDGTFTDGQDWNLTPEIYVRVFQRQDFDSAMPTGAFSLTTLRFAAGGKIASIEGWLDGSVMVGTATKDESINTKAGNTLIGASSQAGIGDYNGDIAEILIYNRALSDTERRDVERYLGIKWLGWGPPVTDGLVLHLDASDSDSITKDSSDNVSDWEDLSGNANHAAQGTTANQPLWVDNQLAGKPVMTFDGATSYLTIPDDATLEPSDISVFMVAVPAAWTTGASCFFAKRTAFSDGYILLHVESAQELWFDWGGSGANRWQTGYEPPLATPIILNLSRDTGGRYLHINGDPEADTVNAGNSALVPTASALFIGRDALASQYYFNGDIAEILIFDRALSDAERKDMELYLWQKWLTPWPVEITADSDSKVYGDTYTFDDDEYAITDGSLFSDHTMTLTLSSTGAAAGAAVGPYDIDITNVQIMANGTDVTADYAITPVKGTLQVTARPLGITADSDSKTYDGTALTDSGYSITAGSLATGHTLQSVTVTGSQTAVGSSNNVPSAAVIVDGSMTDVTTNYNITYVNGTLTVTKAPITITADSKSKVHGTPDPAFTYTITSGTLFTPDAIIGALTRDPGEAVGNYAITQGTLTIDNIGNYDLTFVPGTLTIGSVFGVGLYEPPARTTFHLKNQLEAGDADRVFAFGLARKAFTPVAGDWNNNGFHGVGLYEEATRTFYLKDDHSAGDPDYTLTISGVRRGCYPLAGDWNGDGSYGVGVYDPQNRTFYLRNDISSSGPADIVFTLTWARSGCMPVAGDWNGNGTYGVGLYDPMTGTFYIKNSLASGNADATFTLSWAARSWRPVAGDWNGDGTYGVGVYDPSKATFYLKDALAAGNADYTFTLGWAARGWWPVAGFWMNWA